MNISAAALRTARHDENLLACFQLNAVEIVVWNL